jgi:chromosome partitioning protein
MRTNTTLVVNPKGGSGKTTIAVNLASCFAVDNISTTLMDYDPQGSSLGWLHSRPHRAPAIHGANGAPQKFGRLRSLDMYVPPETQQLVVDAPAGTAGLLLHELLERSHCVLVPVIPSVIDIRASEAFIKDLLAVSRVRTGELRLGIVANKVRVSMPAYQPFLHFLRSLEVQVVARVLDSDIYLKTVETGLGIFELDPGMTASERRQFTPIGEWVRAERPVQIDVGGTEPAPIRRVAY